MMWLKKIWDWTLIILLGILGLVVALALAVITWIFTGYIFYLLEATGFSVILFLGIIVIFRLHASHAWGFKINEENEFPNFCFLSLFLMSALQISKIFFNP